MPNLEQTVLPAEASSSLLRKPVRHYFNLFMQAPETPPQRSGSWQRLPAKAYFLSFTAPPAVQPNPTKLPYRLSRESISGVFGTYIWE